MEIRGKYMNFHGFTWTSPVEIAQNHENYILPHISPHSGYTYSPPQESNLKAIVYNHEEGLPKPFP